MEPLGVLAIAAFGLGVAVLVHSLGVLPPFLGPREPRELNRAAKSVPEGALQTFYTAYGARPIDDSPDTAAAIWTLVADLDSARTPPGEQSTG